jgi:hypothetical protein
MSATLTWMSTIGLAARPGTEAEPTCSIRQATCPRRPASWSRQASNLSGPRFDAGVVDQHVQSAVGFDGLRRRSDGRVVGDVDQDHPRAQSLGGPVAAFGVSAAEIDGVARGDEPAGGLEAESLVRSGDQCCRHASRLGFRACSKSNRGGIRGADCSQLLGYSSSLDDRSADMAEVVLFHHVQGLTDGVRAFAEGLRVGGRTVHTPDLFDGERPATIDDGIAHIHSIGEEVLGDRADLAVADLPEDLVYAGFSWGAGTAQRFAQTRSDRHLFADSSLPSYDANAAALVMRRSREFLDRAG